MTRARGTPGTFWVPPKGVPGYMGGYILIILIDKSMYATCHVLDMPTPKSTIGWVLKCIIATALDNCGLAEEAFSVFVENSDRLFRRYNFSLPPPQHFLAFEAMEL